MKHIFHVNLCLSYKNTPEIVYKINLESVLEKSAFTQKTSGMNDLFFMVTHNDITFGLCNTIRKCDTNDFVNANKYVQIL